MLNTSGMKKVLALAIVSSLLTAFPAYSFEFSTKNPKPGQFCAAKEVGLKVNGLICKKSGYRNRWTNL
jgi:hypothetical protein